MNYQRFTTSMRMSELVHANVHLLRVLLRFDIHPGFGDRTIRDVCRERGIDPEFFIEIVNVYHDPLYFPETRLRRLDIPSVVAYLKRANRDYAMNMLPAIRRMVDALVASAEGRNRGIGMVGTMYLEYEHEFLHHVSQEEELVFVHALRVEEAFRTGRGMPAAEYANMEAVRAFTEQHSHMEEKLLDLRNILLKYIEPPFDVNRCADLILALQLLEQDANDHARIEDRILYAVTAEMEAGLHA